MSVIFDSYEYALYIGATGEWTMHIYDLTRSVDEGQWAATVYNVSQAEPVFPRSRSTVTYNAWK